MLLSKKLIATVIPVAFSIVALLFGFHSLTLSQKHLDDATDTVNKASLHILDICGDLSKQMQDVFVEYGPGDNFNQFMQQENENIKACSTSIQQTKDFCKDHSSMSVCKDPRLEQLSTKFP